MSGKVLIIDDERLVRAALRRVLQSDGFDIIEASRGAEALDILSDTDVSVILCDHNMPEMTGSELLAAALKIQPDAIRITLTASADLDTARTSINDGRISHFLLKPWDDDQLRMIVRESVQRFEMQHEIRQLHEVTKFQRDELKSWNEGLEIKVRERTAALNDAYEGTLDALVLALDSREHATAGHSRRVAMYCLFLAISVGFPEDRLEDLHRGATLHDLGKIGVPDAVLLKPGRLDPEERKVIEEHVVIGGRILKPVPHLKGALPIPLYHHERFDGSGYSEGLAGESIPLEARIFSVVDVYDALRSERPYKSAMTHSEACTVLTKGAGTHFDPQIATAFLDLPASKWEALAGHAETGGSFSEILAACRRVAIGMKVIRSAS